MNILFKLIKNQCKCSHKNALLYSKEAIEINQNEINYKKQAYEIALSLGDEKKIRIYKNQLKRSEEVLKLTR